MEKLRHCHAMYCRALQRSNQTWRLCRASAITPGSWRLAYFLLRYLTLVLTLYSKDALNLVTNFPGRFRSSKVADLDRLYLSDLLLKRHRTTPNSMYFQRSAHAQTRHSGDRLRCRSMPPPTAVV